jgi:uncharacterized membrane protein YebE (DUF533 family)
MAILQQHQSGETAVLAKQLLTEVAVAKVCLLSRPRRQSYDAQLRQKLQGVGPGRAASVVVVSTTVSRKTARRVVTAAIAIAIAIAIYCCAIRGYKGAEKQPPSDALRLGLTATESAASTSRPAVAHRPALDDGAAPPVPQRSQR